MKHGDKEKGKSAKAVSKTSGKKAGQSSGKAGASGKGSLPAKAAAKSSKGQVGSAAKSANKEEGGNGSTKSRTAEVLPAGGFTNPAVGAGFKRALKKYPNALRKLSD